MCCLIKTLLQVIHGLCLHRWCLVLLKIQWVRFCLYKVWIYFWYLNKYRFFWKQEQPAFNINNFCNQCRTGNSVNCHLTVMIRNIIFYCYTKICKKLQYNSVWNLKISAAFSIHYSRVKMLFISCSYSYIFISSILFIFILNVYYVTL